MKILLLGSGGREHALAWKMAQSDLVSDITVLPGNDGMAQLAKTECIATKCDDIDAVLKFALNFKPDLTVVGPEQPLALGITDVLEAEGFKVFGPSQKAAQLESSKMFSKDFMKKYDIPTAKFTTHDNYKDAAEALENWDVAYGVAIKADELAAGKGVVVTNDIDVARKTLHDFMVDKECTVQTEGIVIEQMLKGKEVSAFAICDGTDFMSFGYACDYKRIFNEGLGANTGGMGGYAPTDWPSLDVKKFVDERVFKKTLDGMREDNMPFCGILFAGLMIDGDDVGVIEFNVRLGDPEAQILLPLMEDDIVPILLAAAEGDLKSQKDIKINTLKTSVHVVAVSGGYPSTDGTPMKLGQEISFPAEFLTDVQKQTNDNKSLLFISGAKQENNQWVNSGGRVLGVTAIGDNLAKAQKDAYDMINKISFDGAHWRTDIGQ